MTRESVAINSRRLSGSTGPLTTWSSSVPATGSRNTSRPAEPTCGTPCTPFKIATATPNPTGRPDHDPDPEVTAMTLTINDTAMTSDRTAIEHDSAHSPLEPTRTPRPTELQADREIDMEAEP